MSTSAWDEKSEWITTLGWCVLLVLFFVSKPGLCSEKCRAMRHTYTTRMLYTVLPSERYAPDSASLHTLMDSLVKDLNRAAEEGIEARCCSIHVPYT